MANEPENDKGPACACGKVDLYDEWLKQNEEKEKISTPTCQVENQMRSSIDAGSEDTKLVQTNNWNKKMECLSILLY